MNQLTLYGHLGKDPEKQTTQSGNEFWTFNLAEKIRRKDKDDDVRWWRVMIWRKGLEGIIKHLKKGHAVVVNGEMQDIRKYQDQYGETQLNLSCIAHHISFPPFGNPKKEEEEQKKVEEPPKEALPKEEPKAPEYRQGKFDEDISEVFDKDQ